MNGKTGWYIFKFSKNRFNESLMNQFKRLQNFLNKSVALTVSEIIGGTQKLGAVLGYAHTLYSPPAQKNPICLPYRLFTYVHSFSRYFRLQFWVGIAKPKSWETGGRRGGGGSGMVPLESPLVSSYRPCIVSFPPSLRVSEILHALLSSSTPLFPYSTSSLPKISPCSLGSRWIAFSLQRAKVLG